MYYYMKSIDVLGYLLLGCTIVIVLNMYHFRQFMELTCKKSNVDGKKYCVRKDSTVQQSVDMLATVTVKCKKLVAHLKKKYETRDSRVNLLVKNFRADKVYEILPSSNFTAYSENKGEKLAFCLNTTKKGEEPIDENTLTFVALHELSHIATKSIGHTEEFWNNFKFLIQEAEAIGIYNVVDYKKTPQNYCGTEIKRNPYFRE